MLHDPSNVSHVQFISKYGTQFETSNSNSYSPNLKPMCLLNTNYYNYKSIIIGLTVVFNLTFNLINYQGHL